MFCTAKKVRNGILICGAYGLGNAGDEAILSAILREVRTAAPDADITVLSRDPAETAARNGVKALYFFDLPGMHRVLSQTRLYINGGGSLIQDATSRRSLWYYLYTLHAAKRHGCRVLMYGCGIGPVTYRGDRALTRRVLNRCADMITLRESDSLRELEALRVRKPEIILSADPALTLTPAPEAEVDAVLERAGIPPHGKYLCLALRNWKGYAKKASVFGAAARYAWEKYGLTPVFTAIEKRQDPSAHRPAAATLDGIPHYFLDDAGDTGTIIGALSRMEVIVSMRLHALIFAAGQGIPLVGAVYDPKVSAFLRYMGEDLFTDLDTLTEPVLCGLLDKAVSRAGHPEAQARTVAHLRDIESRNMDAVRRLWER
ncbi:MAG: polysaccharide pyruvyl transferase CsaB [Oscillospiraceae bacterium]|nr:polysaccharide pyruvyl transferase CsaB [Oscillospiraceae bacterium]